MEELKWIVGKLKPHTLLIFLALSGSVLQSIGASAIALTVKSVIDNVFILKVKEELLKTILILLSSAILMQFGFFMSRYLLSKVSEKVLKSVREEIFRKLLFTSYDFFIKHPSGDLISRIVSDVEKLRSIFIDSIPVLLREPFVALALFLVLLYRDPFLTLILILVIPFMAFTVRYFGKKKGKHLKRTQENMGLLTQTLSQLINGIENIKVFLAEKLVLERFKEVNERIYKSSVKSEFYIAGNTAVNYIFGYFVTSLILLYGGFRIISGDLTTGDFVSYLTAIFMIQPPILNTQKALMNLKGSLSVVKRINEVLKLPEEEDGKEEIGTFREKIVFKKVNVSLNGKKILKNINLEIKKGEKIGIAGHTGSGKSTLVRIIPKLIGYEGSVLIDGKELKEIKVQEIRRKVGFLTQETFLINASIRENLKIAKADATDEEIEKALKLAVCDFVFKLKEEVDTVIGERGYMLSGGERQRLSIARIFLKNPEIIILDEATSALDPKTEEKVLNNIFEHFKDRTIIVIAHRITNLERCERIVVMKNGEIVEEGSFKELLEKGKEFKSIFKNSVK